MTGVSRLRIVIAGYIVRGPIGGMAWHHLQYVMGLARLGHDVYFVEDSDDTRWCCYDPSTGKTDADPAYGLRFAADAFERVGLGNRWTYHDAHTSRWLGPAAERAHEIFTTADLLLNLSGSNPVRPWMLAVPVRAYIDTDPVFTQIRHLQDEARRARAAQHTVFLSFGENIGRPECTVPDDGFSWMPTRQPVVLDAWPVTPGPHDGRFTTVLQWDSYAVREHGGRRYGMKSESFEPYLDLPGRSSSVFELALGGESAPQALLSGHGWEICDPLAISKDPWTYQRYLQASKAEFSVAKQGYVASHSGWFSERSAVYLASGRPVLVQDSGFSEWLATGSGVIPFTTRESALDGLEDINRRYAHHCRAARAIAEGFFDSQRVLADLLARAFGS